MDGDLADVEMRDAVYDAHLKLPAWWARAKAEKRFEWLRENL